MNNVPEHSEFKMSLGDFKKHLELCRAEMAIGLRCSTCGFHPDQCECTEYRDSSKELE